MRSLPKGGIATCEQACVIRELWRTEGYSVGFTNGCFDLVHPGHIAVLRHAASECDRLIVAVNSDRSAAKKRKPIQNDHARAIVVSAIEGVDLVVILHEDTPLDMIRELAPDVLVKGEDYSVEEIVGSATVERLVRVPMVGGQSTTELIRRVRQHEQLLSPEGFKKFDGFEIFLTLDRIKYEIEVVKSLVTLAGSMNNPFELVQTITHHLHSALDQLEDEG